MSNDSTKPNAAVNRFTHPPPADPVMENFFKTHNLPKAVMPANPIQKVLKGQKALVTGANSGIGEGVALALAHAGADVVINYVTHPEAAEELVRKIKSHGANAYAHPCDVSKED
jgi:NADPH:quinone reductase-like Zn-dependent oxidoreductase